MLAGERYGRLEIVRDRQPGEQRIYCRCDCGNELTVSRSNLRTGNSRSCGHDRNEGARNPRFAHGMAGTRIYNIWADMVGRCTRPTHIRYADYGGRGITVCDRWRDFANFYADMDERPEGRSLDRIDNDLGYSPQNCRWATASEQASNKRGFGLERRVRDAATGCWLPGTTTTNQGVSPS